MCLGKVRIDWGLIFLNIIFYEDNVKIAIKMLLSQSNKLSSHYHEIKFLAYYARFEKKSELIP